MELNDKLRMLRKKICKTQKEVADDLGISKQSMNLYESSRGMPSPTRLRYIADYYGVSVDYLMNDVVNEQSTELSVEENVLLTKFRKLSKDGKLQILMQIDFLLYGGITTNIKM